MKKRNMVFSLVVLSVFFVSAVLGIVTAGDEPNGKPDYLPSQDFEKIDEIEAEDGRDLLLRVLIWLYNAVSDLQDEVEDLWDAVLWTDADGYIYPNNVGTNFQITDTGNLSVPGNVGIGTTNPEEKLDVDGNVTVRGKALEVTGGAGSYIKVGKPELGYSTTFSYEYDGSMFDTYIKNPCGRGVGCDLILDFPYGNVGIGTTEPKTKLHIEGDAYISDNLTIGAPLFFDAVNERIGIGTLTPQKKLEMVSRDYTDLGIRLSTELLGGTSWDIENDKGVFEIAEHVAIPPEYPRTKITATRGEVGIEAVDGAGKPVPGATLHVFGGNFMVSSAPATWVGGYSTEINGSTIIGDCVGCPPGADALHLKVADNQGNILIAEDGGRVGIGTGSPARKLHVNDVMRLEPRSTAPSSPSEGDIYMNGTSHKLMVYDGTTWQACW